jgi:dTDP-4-dehydrorhamnose 3,5-epimerase
MNFREMDLGGAYLIEMDRLDDARGHFVRVYASEEFARHGLAIDLAQQIVSFNRSKATLRGLHYQLAPFEQTKLVRCSQGSILDVIVDLRAASPTFRHWASVELSAKDDLALYVPQGFAHGFLTLEEASEVTYLITGRYDPASERGVRWDDPDLAIDWPFAPAVLSARDAALPALADQQGA